MTPRKRVNMGALVLLALLIVLAAALPTWPYRVGWGYYPSGLLGLMLLGLGVWLLFGRR
jgi:Protein of unknown function (DUF3309)